MNAITAFAFSRHRKARAVFLLLVLMGGLQSVIYWLDRSTIPVDFVVFDTTLQATIDSLKKEATKPTIYPFNPNYLTDYRAYFLELTPKAIDRLLAFRQNGNWIHSAQEFQHITQVNAQWMEKYAPYFKFPKTKKLCTAFDSCSQICNT